MNLNLQIKLTNVHFAAVKMFSKNYPHISAHNLCCKLKYGGHACNPDARARCLSPSGWDLVDLFVP